MIAAIEKKVYEESTKESELSHTFKNDTYINVIVAWKNWVRVSAHTPEKNIFGWCKTRYLDDLY